MAGKIRVCILDLYPIFRLGLANLINAELDFWVDCQTSDPEEALDFVSYQQPEILLLDIETPHLRGFDVLHHIQIHNLATRSICLSRIRTEDDFVLACDLGASAYLRRESSGLEMIRALRAVAGGETQQTLGFSNCAASRPAPPAHPPRSELVAFGKLTPSEFRILWMIGEDKTSKEIAAELGISPRTVENHRNNMSVKLNLRGSHSLLRFAFDKTRSLVAQYEREIPRGRS